MKAAHFAIVTVVAVLSLSAPAFYFARRRTTLHIFDLGIVLGPAPLLFFTLALFNEPVHTGWGMIIYPFLALVLSVLALYVRVFAGWKTAATAKVVSITFLLGGCVFAVLAGFCLHPYYE